VGGGKGSDFGAFSSAQNEYESLYRYGGDVDDDHEDEEIRRLYYYQTPDEVDESGSIGDVPPAILSKMESDPTYFHGMEALALHWTTPSTDPPSRDGRVQAVMRDIIMRQNRARNGAEGQEDGDQNVRVIIRVPRTNANVESGDDGIEVSDFGANYDDVEVGDTSDDEEDDKKKVGTDDTTEDESSDDTDEAEPRTILKRDPSPVGGNDGAGSRSVAEPSVPEGASLTTLSKASARRIAELERFKEEHGHVEVPWIGETKSLYFWLNSKKKAYDELKNDVGGSGPSITQEEINILEELGVNWTVNAHVSTESRLAALARFKEKHGHLNIPRRGEYTSLYNWLYGKKTQHDDFLAGKETALTQTEFDRLNELGLDWSFGGQKTNGYINFVRLRTEEMKASNTDLSPAEVKDKVLLEWREMSDEEKVTWKAKADNQ